MAVLSMQNHDVEPSGCLYSCAHPKRMFVTLCTAVRALASDLSLKRFNLSLRQIDQQALLHVRGGMKKGRESSCLLHPPVMHSNRVSPVLTMSPPFVSGLAQAVEWYVMGQLDHARFSVCCLVGSCSHDTESLLTVVRGMRYRSISVHLHAFEHQVTLELTIQRSQWHWLSSSVPDC
jgi:hypothetical protein